MNTGACADVENVMWKLNVVNNLLFSDALQWIEPPNNVSLCESETWCKQNDLLESKSVLFIDQIGQQKCRR